MHNPVNSAIGCVFEKSKGSVKGGASHVSIQTKNILETLELLKKKTQNQLCDIAHSTFPLGISFIR